MRVSVCGREKGREGGRERERERERARARAREIERVRVSVYRHGITSSWPRTERQEEPAASRSKSAGRGSLAKDDPQSAQE